MIRMENRGSSARTRYVCDRQHCSYVSEGATRAQAADRMARHWTARDHKEFVDAILSEEAPRV